MAQQKIVRIYFSTFIDIAVEASSKQSAKEAALEEASDMLEAYEDVIMENLCRTDEIDVYDADE